MASQINYNTQQNYRQYQGVNEAKYFPYQNNQYNPVYSNKKVFLGSNRTTNDISSMDTDSYSFQNQNFTYDKHKNSENRIVLKNTNEFVNELFRVFSEKNSLCNFSLFERNIDINMNLDKSILKKMTLSDYFDCFNEASFLCLNVPYLDKKGNLSFNIFNPTLSSMNLILKNKKLKEEDIDKNYLKDNFSVNFINEELLKIEFDESNPPYNRDIIETKINMIYKILGQKKILLENVVKDKSYFSILWTPADTYKIKSSFLSFYTFDFKLIGTVIIRIDDYNWFTIFCNDVNNYKDFKKEYINKVNTVESFLKKCNNIDDEESLERNLISYDYKKFRNNY